jgi:hypothetical protein
MRNQKLVSFMGYATNMGGTLLFVKSVFGGFGTGIGLATGMVGGVALLSFSVWLFLRLPRAGDGTHRDS